MEIATQIRHRVQELPYSCGAACVSILLGISEEEARRRCGTKTKGTSAENIGNALKAVGLNVFHVKLNQPIEQLWDCLQLASCRWPLIVTGQFIEKAPERRGRALKREHAFVVVDGMVYDPGERGEYPVEAIWERELKRLVIREILLIEEERAGYQNGT